MYRVFSLKLTKGLQERRFEEFENLTWGGHKKMKRRDFEKSII